MLTPAVVLRGRHPGYASVCEVRSARRSAARVRGACARGGHDPACLLRELLPCFICGAGGHWPRNAGIRRHSAPERLRGSAARARQHQPGRQPGRPARGLRRGHGPAAPPGPRRPRRRPGAHRAPAARLPAPGTVTAAHAFAQPPVSGRGAEPAQFAHAGQQNPRLHAQTAPVGAWGPPAAGARAAAPRAGRGRGHLGELLPDAGLLRAGVRLARLRPAALRQHHLRCATQFCQTGHRRARLCRATRRSRARRATRAERGGRPQAWCPPRRCARATASTRSSAATATPSTRGSWPPWVRLYKCCGSGSLALPGAVARGPPAVRQAARRARLPQAGQTWTAATPRMRTTPGAARRRPRFTRHGARPPAPLQAPHCPNPKPDPLLSRPGAGGLGRRADAPRGAGRDGSLRCAALHRVGVG